MTGTPLPKLGIRDLIEEGELPNMLQAENTDLYNLNYRSYLLVNKKFDKLLSEPVETESEIEQAINQIAEELKEL